MPTNKEKILAKEKTIKIYVEGGAVIDVINIPPNYSCEIIDYDLTEGDEDYEGDKIMDIHEAFGGKKRGEKEPIVEKAVAVARGEMAEDLGRLAFDTANSLRDLIREYLDECHSDWELNPDIDVDVLVMEQIGDLQGEISHQFDMNQSEWF